MIWRLIRPKDEARFPKGKMKCLLKSRCANEVSETLPSDVNQAREDYCEARVSASGEGLALRAGSSVFQRSV